MGAEIRNGKENDASGPLPNSLEPVRFRLLISICAAFIAGVGLVALLGWMLKLPVLASLGSGMVPVAPSTAVLFVLYACAIFLRTHLPESRVAYWTGLSVNAAGALLATLLFGLSLLGIRPAAEHFGFYVVNKPGELQMGHMSLVTALCFLRSSLSYLLSLLSRERRQTASISWWLACVIIATGLTLVLAYLYGTPILYGSSFIPPAALTSMAFMALGTALLILATPQAGLARPNVESTTRATYTFLRVFVLLAAGIVTSGYMYYRNYEIRQRTEVEQQLSAIADLKVDGLVNWRKERMGDASLFYQNDNFSIRVKNYFQKPEDDENEQRLRIWLQHAQEGYKYDHVFLLDARGRERMSASGTQRPISNHLILRAAEALRTKQVAFEDFYRNEHDGRVYLAVLAPILDKQDNDRAVGTLVLRVDPEQYLYPFLNRWPAPSKTAETLLVRREGNEALFLNELRFQKNTALNLRRSLDQKDFPAAQAVLGRKGIMEGRDYRGVPVIADLRAVPGSPWFLVSRMDVAEVYGPLREKLWMTIALVMALLIGAGASVGMVWRRQRTQFYREKYETAEALNESEEKYRHIVENLGREYLFYRHDTNGVFVYISPSITGMLGYSQKEALSNYAGFLSDNPMNKEVIRHTALSIQGLQQLPCEMEIVHKDGSLRCLEVTEYPVRNQDGSVVAVEGIARDITERKHTEEALRASERQYRLLVDNAPVGVYKTTLEGKFLYVNDALARIFECENTAEMLLPSFDICCKKPEDRETFLKILKEQGKVPYFETEISTKTGKLKTVIISAALEDGFITGMVTDINERKHLEAQLRHAQKMEAVGTLAGGIAHDLNNILNVIIGYGTMVLDRMEADSLSKGQMNEVLAAAERAAVLTKRLLAFSRKQLAEVKPIHINETVIGVQKMLDRIIGEDIDFQLDLGDGSLMVTADAGQIEQVLMNLVSNAKDAMPNGGRLTIGTGLQEIDDEYIALNGYGEPGTYALITVSDTGNGIDTETQKKIFEPFFTTKGIGEGTGLGLAISYGIIKQHNGYIKVYSEQGTGSVFKIYLPLLEEAASLEMKTEAAVPVRGGNETVLLAEDDASLRKLSRIVLESFGYTVIAAEEGEDAIAKFTENRERIDLAILDVIMPRRSGKEVSEVLRKANPRLKILFVSGYTMDIIKKEELTESGFDFIHKPVRPQDLLKKVREALDRKEISGT